MKKGKCFNKHITFQINRFCMPKIILRPIKTISFSMFNLTVRWRIFVSKMRNAGLLYRVPQDDVEKKD